MGLIPLHDIAAVVVAVGLLITVAVLAVSGGDCPEYIRTAFALAIGWVFRGGAQLSNELRHRGRVNNDDGPSTDRADSG